MLNFDIGFENFSKTDPGVLFICLMGVGTVFVGLICLIVVCKLLGLFCGKAPAQPQPAAQPAPDQPVENRQQLLAAVSAAVAEELGTEVEAIRVTSFRKV